MQDKAQQPPWPDAAAIARRDRRIAELAEALERAQLERDALAETARARSDELALVTAMAERYRAAAERTAETEAELQRLRAALDRAEARLRSLETGPDRGIAAPLRRLLGRPPD